MIAGSTRNLPDDLLLSDGYDVAVSPEAIPLLDLSSWSTSDTDEQVDITLRLSLNEYVALATCVDVGRDIAYGDNSNYLWWLWCRAVNSLSGGGGVSNIEIAQLEERQNEGVNAGATLTNAWVVRPLNTSVKTYSWINLDVVNNEFTLQAGTYFVRAVSSVFGSNAARLALWRDGSIAALGVNGKSEPPTGATVTEMLELVAMLTMTVAQTYSLQMWTKKPNTTGMGRAVALPGFHETYSVLTVEKMA